VAPAYVFFASNADSSYITGEVLTLLGGKQRSAWRRRSAKLLRAAATDMPLVRRKHE